MRLWKKYFPINGQVQQHLSPFEQQIAGPFMSKLPTNTVKEAVRLGLEAGPGLLVGIGIYMWSEAEHKNIAFHHRI